MSSPEPPVGTDQVMAQERYKSELAVWQAQQADNIAARAELRATEAALLCAVQAAYLSVAESSLDRALQRTNVLTGSVSAIATANAALLGLIYAAGKDAKPLPVRAVAPFVFLGLTLLFSSVHAAFLRGSTVRMQLLPTGIGGAIAETRLDHFFTWTFASILRRAWALRLAVVTFGVSVVLLPLPYIDLSDAAAGWLTGGGAVIVAVWAVGEWLSSGSAAALAANEHPGLPALRRRL